MAWTCPVCGKTFAKPKQSHKCEQVDIDDLFDGKAAYLPGLYATLLQRVQERFPCRPSFSRKAITMYAANHQSFLVVHPKRDALDLWFPLDRKEQTFPIFKIIQASKSRYAHYVRLEVPEEIDALLLTWIAEAHQLVCPEPAPS